MASVPNILVFLFGCVLLTALTTTGDRLRAKKNCLSAVNMTASDPLPDCTEDLLNEGGVNTGTSYGASNCCKRTGQVVSVQCCTKGQSSANCANGYSTWNCVCKNLPPKIKPTPSNPRPSQPICNKVVYYGIQDPPSDLPAVTQCCNTSNKKQSQCCQNPLQGGSQCPPGFSTVCT